MIILQFVNIREIESTTVRKKYSDIVITAIDKMLNCTGDHICVYPVTYIGSPKYTGGYVLL